MLKGKTAIVTGSTSGIGLAIATVLAEAGCNLVLNGFTDKATIKNIQDSLQNKFGVNTFYSGADMIKPSEIEQMIKDTIKHFNTIDILVNNAGIQHVAPIEEFPDNKWDAIIGINLSSSFYTIKHAIPQMKKQNSGRIINIASAHGLVASTGKAAYVAAKHGLIGLTKVVALENAQLNITCNSICPGWVLTPLVEQQIKNNAISHNISIEEATRALLAEKQPSLRFVKDMDIGQLVLFLCSEASLSITGTHVSIDGGWTAQ
ncbi:D-beta-hydroxybutyrate dehydrogenase [Rickettsiales bacterium Ac37b]|nr:D-beta-hydroxybutyrate dehydrogenase [Rickettsiales bacterium Ac37b]